MERPDDDYRRLTQRYLLGSVLALGTAGALVVLPLAFDVPQLLPYAAIPAAVLAALGLWLFARSVRLRPTLDLTRDPVLLVVTRDCTLCRRAETVLRRLQRAHGFPLLIADAMENAALAEFAADVPVILYRGDVLAQTQIDPALVETGLLRRQRAAGP